VVAVVVTYNRRDLLTQCLDALAAQTTGLRAIVVVDNDSTDGTADVLSQHPAHPEALYLSHNVGGAGGFAAGIAYALTHHDPDWVWVMDDDTIPRDTALEALLTAQENSELPLSVLSSRAVWTDGRNHPMNLPRTRMRARANEVANAERIGCRPVRTASYVSALLRAEDVRHHGLPQAGYFIWSDDFEHTGRLLRSGYGVHVPASVVEHRTKLFGNAQESPGNRFYFDVRNRLWVLFRSRSFKVWERAIYGSKTALGWLRQLARHPQLMRPGLKGFWDAVTTKPAPADQVFAADPPVASLIKEMEDEAPRCQPSPS
jgi:rhamnopyranosyl-N-acetylglucosaminyl-diphospho-decaprenol beta-1,3/1,4-galactofuranosyltransferase